MKGSTSTFLVTAKPHPFKTEVIQSENQVGLTVLDALGHDVDDTVSVALEGEYIPREMWERIKPKAGTEITVVRYPEGRTVKKIVGIVLLVLIAIYAPYLLSYMTSLYGTWGTVLAIGITMLATMAAYALIPPPELPKIQGGAGEEFNRLNAITGTSNQATPYGTIPMVLGECRFYPTFAANPYTEILGDQQYLRMLLDLGYGDLEISDIKIGETDIAEYDDVDYEVSLDPDLFSDDFFEVSLVDAFNNGAVVTKTTQTNTDEIGVDIVFTGGLFGVDSKGKTTQATTTFRIEYREVGSAGAWSNVTGVLAAQRSISTPSVTVSGANFQARSSARKVMRVGIRWQVTQGQYDVRMSRFSTTFGADTQSSTQFDSAQLAVIRSIRHTNPSNTGTLKLALRIKATDQLNGVINQLSVLGQQKIRVWNGSTWLPPAVNFNPAWIYHWLLTTCPGVAVLVPDSRVDLPGIYEWAQECTNKGFTCKGILDRGVSHGDLLKLVLAAGRASFAMKDGKYSVLFDKDSLVPVQHFTPANSKDFTGNRVFIDLPHALRVKFQNPALNWQEDEIIVLDDLHSYDGRDARGAVSALPPATKFETLTVPYVTEPVAAWQLGRYQIAQATYRPNVYSWSADIEHLICTRGDLVYAVHDVTEWGAGFGLIGSLVRNGSSQVIQITSHEPLIVEVGETYSIRVRDRTGGTSISQLTAMSLGENFVFNLMTPLSANIQETDLYMIGKTSSGIKQLLITKIEPSNDMNATLQAVEYHAAVQTYDDDPPSSFSSAISGTLILEPPPPPVIYAVFSNDSVTPPGSGGNSDPGIGIGIGGGSSGYLNVGGGGRLTRDFRSIM